MKPPVYKDLPPQDPPLTFIIPYDKGLPFNPLHVCRNDTVLIIYGGATIGHKRIKGAQLAKTEWLVFLDADGIYPKDFALKVKRAIKRYGRFYPAMMAWREHPAFAVYPRPLESGLIVRRDVFLERTKNYPDDMPYFRGFKTDIVEYFHDAVVLKCPDCPRYYHPTSKDEKETLKAIPILLTPILALI